MIKAGGALPFLIAPRRGKIYPAGQQKGDSGVMADHHFEAQRSTLFDALYIPSGAESAKTLKSNGRCIHWVREAFGHLKTIGAIGEGTSVQLGLVSICADSLHQVSRSWHALSKPKCPRSASRVYKIAT